MYEILLHTIFLIKKKNDSFHISGTADFYIVYKYLKYLKHYFSSNEMSVLWGGGE